MLKCCVFSFLTVLMVGCKMSDGTTAINTVQFDNGDSTVLSLKEGQAHILPTSGVRVALRQVLEDSRCPKGVQCVWAGVGIVEIELTGHDGKTSLDTISTVEVKRMGYKQSTSFANHRITLEALNPYPVSGENSINRGVYNALISVVR